MRALDTIKSTKFEVRILLNNVYIFFCKTHVAFVIKINKISLLSNSMQTTLNLKRSRPSHWSISKLITANDTIRDTCY